MTKFEFEKLGTRWWVQIETQNSAEENQIEPIVLFLADEFEKRYSRFDSKSKLYKLNSTKKLSNPGDEFIQMLKFAQEIKDQTYGYFDIRVAGLLEKLGYGKVSDLEEKADLNDSKKILFNRNYIELGKSTKIDFGSFGKGWLIDNLFTKLNSLYKIKNLMINAGGDIRYQSQEVKSFQLQNPLNANQAIAEVSISSGSLGASAPSFRKWKTKEGQVYHHLLNPLAKTSEYQYAGVFVLASEAKVADAMATAMFVSPPELHQNLAETFNFSYLLIYPDGKYFSHPNFPAKMY